ncbi:MAG: hypothetical protein CMA21_04560 [Euryarchaeota archaeon]|nr:hypothetical protein [Euryarchaeota archaeon]
MTQDKFTETIDCTPPVGKDLIFSTIGNTMTQVSRPTPPPSRSAEIFPHPMLPGCRRIIPSLGDGNQKLRCGDPCGPRNPGEKAICIECFESYTNQVNGD